MKTEAICVLAAPKTLTVTELALQWAGVKILFCLDFELQLF